jgi:hypothetical protein
MAVPGLAITQAQPQTPAGTTVTSDITADTTWALAGSPYNINAHIDILNGSTLTIEPGVVVRFQGGYLMTIYSGGSIIAKGTPSNHITFERPSGGDRWKKIWFLSDTSSYFRYTDFSGAGSEAADYDTTLHYQGAGTHVLNNCTISDGEHQAVVAAEGAEVTIAGTHVSDQNRRGMTVESGAIVTVSGSTFLTGSKKAIVLDDTLPASTLTVTDSNLITDRDRYAILNEFPNKTCVFAEDNWWGAVNGPFDNDNSGDACGGARTNGGLGSGVSNGVDWGPYRTSQAALVGITTPPAAALAVTPDPTTPLAAGTTYTFTAAATTDVEDYVASLQFCWDWDGDGGGCDATTITATTSFAGGLHTVLLTVTDTDGLTGTVTQKMAAGRPTASIIYTQTTWAETLFDASSSSDWEDPTSSLLAQWDWAGDGLWNSGAVSATEIQTHTYGHLGRFWPGLMIEDTDSLTDTASTTVDIIPPATSTTISGGGGTLNSVDGSVQTSIYTDSVDSGVLSGGLVITHTPWLTLPHPSLGGEFTYQGFTLSAESQSSGQPVLQVTGTYTITLTYVYTYFTDVLGFLPFENQLKLYRWTGSIWTPVNMMLDADNDQLTATTEFFGDFALSMDIQTAYLPLVVRSY